MTMWFAKNTNKKISRTRMIAMALLLVLVGMLLAASLISLHHCHHEHCQMCLVQKAIYTLLLFAGWWSIRHAVKGIQPVSQFYQRCQAIWHSFALKAVRMDC